MAGGFCHSSQEYKRPPQLNFKLKEADDVPKTTEMWNDDYLPIDILLLTAEGCEFLSCFSFLEQPLKSYKLEIGFVYFGRMGDVASDHEKLKVALTNCSKGAAVPGGPLRVVQNTFRILQPKAVFSVGTCIGLGLEKVKIGDVVIPSKLTTPKGFEIAVRPPLGDLARDAPFGWDAPLENPGELKVNIHSSGNILSPSLTANCRYEDICKQYPGAVAVETEGEGTLLLKVTLG